MKGDIHKHKYLDLTIDFSEKNQVIFAIYNYYTIGTAPSDMNGTALDPAKADLFTIDKSLPLLNVDGAGFFHSTTARYIFAAKQAMHDIQVAAVYLYTRVRKPTIDDYVKLTRVIMYLRATVHLPLIIGPNKSGTLLWSIDALFAVYNNMHSHKGAMMIYVKGDVFSLSNKQKVNSTSSTVAEIIGVGDAMNFVMWVKEFLLNNR